MHFSFLQKLGAAVLIAAWMIYGINFIGDRLVSVGVMAGAAPAAAAAEKPPARVQKAEAVAVAALLGVADAGAGARVFKKCKACHTAKKGGKNKIGPNLWEIVGRAPGSAAGFKYSPAMKALGGTWDYAALDGFLTKPKKYAAGTKMQFAGIKKPKDRAAVVLYLRSLSESPKPLP